MAIRSIRHRGLRRLWERDDVRAVPAQSADKLRRMLAAINRTSVPANLVAAALPGWRVHRLSGDLAGYWSLSVTGNWRLVGRFEDGDAFDLDLVDYH
ncbi:MAG: type II toxin-antitoxin system RelE/ParE family toxin [Geminicoccaceae bacterium]